MRYLLWALGLGIVGGVAGAYTGRALVEAKVVHDEISGGLFYAVPGALIGIVLGLVIAFVQTRRR